jgi:hypothetical protein
MATHGLSLVGFMEEPAATLHLRTACIPPDPTDQALRTAWLASQAKLGTPIVNAGLPEILPIAPAQTPHVVTLMQTPWVAQALQSHLVGSTFQLVEIAPLLAFQFTVDIERSEHHCRTFSRAPTPDELMTTCLPTAITPEPLQVQGLPQSVLIKARCLNVHMLAQGWFQQLTPNMAGIAVGVSLPLVHVVRLKGKCYLHNGFHRAIGAMDAGATHIPCIFRDVADELAAGIKADGTTFGSALLNSANPPTVGHFRRERALEVRLRAHSRIMHVSWAEYVTYDE